MFLLSRIIKVKGEEIKNNKKKDIIEQPYKHLLRIAYGSIMEFAFFTLPYYLTYILTYIEEI